MSTISFNVVAHDLASRVFRGVGNAAMAMAAKISAADALAGRTDGYDRHTHALSRMAVAMQRAAPLIESMQRGLGRLTGENFRGQGRFWFRVVLASLAMAPAVIGPAVYALGALEGALVAVVPGASALGLAMYGVWKRIKLAASSTKEFNKAAPAIQRATEAFKGLNKAYQGFLDKTQGTVGRVFTQAFKGMAELLPKLEPMTNRFARVLFRFLHGVRQEMQSPAFDKALNWLKRVGSITFKNLLHSGENLTKFFFNLARSFQKAGVDIKLGWLKDLTGNLNKWAKGLGNSEGFKRLIAFTKENWPKIAESIGNIFKTIGNITQGMEPIAGKGLDALVVITKKLSEIKPGTWTKLGVAFIGLSVGIKALGIALAGLKIVALLRFAGILGGLGTAAKGASKFAALGRALGTIGTGIAKFGKGLGALGGFGIGSGLFLLLLFLDKWKKGEISKPGKGSEFELFTKFDKWIRKWRNTDINIHFKISGIDVIGSIIAALTVLKALGGAIKIGIHVVGMALLLPIIATIKTLKTIAGVIRIGFKIVGGAALAAARTAILAIKHAVGVIRVILRVIGLGIVRAAAAVLRGIKSVVRRLMLVVSGLPIVRAAAAVLRGIKSVVRRLSLLVSGLGIVRAAKALWQWFKSKLAALRLIVPGIGIVRAAKALWQWFKSKLIRLSMTVSGMGAVSAAKALWNSITSKVVVLTTVLKKIVGKAAGGPVKGRTPYLVGEVGPELFMPDTSGRIIPNHRVGQYANAAGGGGNVYIEVNVTGAVDPVSTGREVQKALLALKRVSGGRALGLA